MDGQVDCMVPGDVEAAQLVVQGEGEVADESARVVLVTRPGKEPVQIAYRPVVDYGDFVVENERGMESSRVGDERQDRYKEKMKGGHCSRFGPKRSGFGRRCGGWVITAGMLPGNGGFSLQNSLTSKSLSADRKFHKGRGTVKGRETGTCGASPLRDSLLKRV